MECLQLLGDNMWQLATWYGQQQTTNTDVVNLVDLHQDDCIICQPVNHIYLQYIGTSKYPPLIWHYQDVLSMSWRRLAKFLMVMQSLNWSPQWIICSSPALQFPLEDEQV
jgi:hypothetical protein